MNKKRLDSLLRMMGVGMALSLGLYAVPNDFNGDGTSDILWNKENKGYVIWCMKNGSKDSEIRLPTRTVRWKVAATGDYDGDGVTDILWQKPDGRYKIWLMSGLDVKDEINIPANRSWSVEPSERAFEPINYGMLRDKTFYFDFRSGESRIVEYYKLVVVDDRKMRLHYMKKNTETNEVLANERMTIRYRLENGVVLADEGDGISRLTLLHRKADQWLVRAEYDAGAIGAYEHESKGVESWYLKKPAHYPAAL